MNVSVGTCDLFRKKAKAVSAVVAEVKTLSQAFAYAVDLCLGKAPCELLTGTDIKGRGQSRHKRIIAAPGMIPEWFGKLDALCRSKNIDLLDSGLQDYLAGIDMGLTLVDYGIAETGTLVLNCPGEDLRLAAMISEIHVAILPKSKIRQKACDLEEELSQMMQSAPGYTAFITGASRTADIERVLALGVHGPLELHILLWEGR